MVDSLELHLAEATQAAYQEPDSKENVRLRDAGNRHHHLEHPVDDKRNDFSD